MRTTPLLLLAAASAVLLACSANGDGPVDPASAPAMRDGTGLIGTGNSMPAGFESDSASTERGTGLIGTGN